MSAQRLIPLFFLVFCTARAVGDAELQAAFSRPEYIPSRTLGADGWPEARRRHLLKVFLRSNGYGFQELQSVRDANRPGDKYRRVALRLIGQGEGTLRVTLALWAGKSDLTNPQIADLQRSCDQNLFSVVTDIRKYLALFQHVEFTMTESCIDLTAQIHKQN